MLRFKYKDPNRCDVIIKIDPSFVSNLSLSDNIEDSWSGKILTYKNPLARDNAEKKDENRKNHHCLESEWLSSPFNLLKDRSDVTVEKSQDKVLLKFQIRKTEKVKEWLFKR